MDADFVMVADGDTRKLDRLKKKRRKHLLATSRELPGILALYEQGRLKDSDLRKQLGPPNIPNPDVAMKEGSVFGQE